MSNDNDYNEPYIGPEPYEMSKARLELEDSSWEGFKKEEFILTKEEARNLQKFLYDNGYISYEKHFPIHELLKRLDKFLEEKMTRYQDSITGEIVDIPDCKTDKLKERKEDLVKYIFSKIDAEDWHAVQDAASDIREIEAKLEWIEKEK